MLNKQYKEEAEETSLSVFEEHMEDIKLFDSLFKQYGVAEKHLEFQGYIYTIQLDNKTNTLKYFKRKIYEEEMSYSDNINKFFARCAR